MNDDTLNFVGKSGAIDNFNPVDSDLASWLVLSGDLLGSSNSAPFSLDDPIFQDNTSSEISIENHVVHDSLGRQHHDDSNRLPNEENMILDRNSAHAPPVPPPFPRPINPASLQQLDTPPKKSTAGTQPSKRGRKPKNASTAAIKNDQKKKKKINDKTRFYCNCNEY